MSSPPPPRPDGLHVLRTTAGDLPLDDYELRVGERMVRILHARAVVSLEEEDRFVLGDDPAVPYGVVLWSASIALAHEIASPAGLRWEGKRVLELGAGTGLPGIVAAALGARVVQTDRQKVALHLCRKNAERNGLASIEQRVADWTAWDDRSTYDCILGSDVLYAPSVHPHLRRILEANLAPRGSVLFADPLRKSSIPFFEAMAADGWTLRTNQWSVGVTPPARPVLVFELTRA